ncbi:hypothetical protein QYE76_013028 [Lolium multiflorum]|uniref:CCHC-type domain-containing protein n=1 Tax=Lolium multiflorum TaxID=4521 RepID=A0AAD8X4G5_LOLMU|nr:hypothetical protein QYE76_013028 [Lolium multiflorum]
MKPKNGPKPDADCYYCKEKGHWKRNCSKYLDLKSGLVKKKKEDCCDPLYLWVITQHLSGLKRAVKEFDTAWHDANANVVGTLDLRKWLFEELLWEHRHLSESFASLELSHSKCQASLPEASFEDLASQLSTLKAEKE